MPHTQSHRSGYAIGLLCIACCVCDLTPGTHGHLFPGVDEDSKLSRKQRLPGNGARELAPMRDSDVSTRDTREELEQM